MGKKVGGQPPDRGRARSRTTSDSRVLVASTIDLRRSTLPTNGCSGCARLPDGPARGTCPTCIGATFSSTAARIFNNANIASLSALNDKPPPGPRTDLPPARPTQLTKAVPDTAGKWTDAAAIFAQMTQAVRRLQRYISQRTMALPPFGRTASLQCSLSQGDLFDWTRTHVKCLKNAMSDPR